MEKPKWLDGVYDQQTDLYQTEPIAMLLEAHGILYPAEPKEVMGTVYEGWCIRLPDGTVQQYDSRYMAVDQTLSPFEFAFFGEKARQVQGEDVDPTSIGHMIDPLNVARRALAELDLAGMCTTLPRDNEAGRAIEALGGLMRVIAAALMVELESPLTDEEIGHRSDLEKSLIDAREQLEVTLLDPIVSWNVGQKRNPRGLRELLYFLRKLEIIFQYFLRIPQLFPPETTTSEEGEV